jgi:UDP-2,3-diacylglucosamine pyrophosphatase LpxH
LEEYTKKPQLFGANLHGQVLAMMSQRSWLTKEFIVQDAIVVSDLHLGSDACQVRLLLDFIDSLPATERLILNGDVLQNTESRLTKQHWHVLSRFRKLADQLELVWIRGNHDYDAESVAHLIGARFVPEYLFCSGDRQVLCVHGDAWDHFLTDHPILTNVADWFYLRVQNMSRSLANSAKRSSKTFLRCVDRVRTAAQAFGNTRHADAIVCGHTHFAEAPPEPTAGGCVYYNCGSWTDHYCHYLAVSDGWFELVEVNADAAIPVVITLNESCSADLSLVGST